MSEHEPQEYPLPDGFDPSLFSENAELMVRRATIVPGFIGLGEVADSEEAIGYEALREEMAPHGINVGLIVLNRLDGGRGYIPVYIDHSVLENVASDRTEQARTIVANNEAFAEMDARQKAREIANLARALAGGGDDALVYRIGEEGEKLITYPQQEMGDVGETS